MRATEVDARRYAWSRGNAIWIMGPPVSQWTEDLEGAVGEGQSGLVRYVARQIGECCALMLALMTRRQKPLPSAKARTAWALRQIEGHVLHAPCWLLVRGALEHESDEEIARRCAELVESVREIVGEVPDLLTAEGYYPAMAIARDWLNLFQTLGEPSFLPNEWMKKG